MAEECDCVTMERFFYPTDVEGRLIWLMRSRRGDDEYVPILYCPWCGRKLYEEER